MDAIVASHVHVVFTGVLRAVEGATGICRKDCGRGRGGALEALAQVGDAGDVGGWVGGAGRRKLFGFLGCRDADIVFCSRSSGHL